MEWMPFRLIPEYRDYVWGGQRLRPQAPLTAEAWVVYAGDQIATGPLAAMSLGEAAQRHGQALLGRVPFARGGGRFPLLIKLLDCAQWLSLQVHPNDQQALELEGPGEYGKTEAWHILEAEPGARLIAGLLPGTSQATFERALRSGSLLEHLRYLPVQAGDTLPIPAGTLHALGPGLLLYEVQESSDWTYRVYDWGRPATPSRPLHLEKSLAVTRVEAQPQLEPPPALRDGLRQTLTRCEYFTLDLLAAETKTPVLEPGGESFIALTVTQGAAELACGGQSLRLERFETALIPAACPPCTLIPLRAAQALAAYVA